MEKFPSVCCILFIAKLLEGKQYLFGMSVERNIIYWTLNLQNT